MDTTFTDSNNIANQNRNRYSYATIPIMVGYEFILKKWYFNLKAGVGFSFLLKNKSKYLNYELTNFISPSPKKILFNYLFSPTASYQFNNKIGLEINPQFIINNSSLINYKDVRQRYTNLGVNLGVNYSF